MTQEITPHDVYTHMFITQTLLNIELSFNIESRSYIYTSDFLKGNSWP